MGVFTAGQVVTVPFPYSDLQGHKNRPALVLAPAGYDDWIICQITSNPYADPFAIELEPTSFVSGALSHTSYARPSKLFTANESIFVSSLGMLNTNVLEAVKQNIRKILQST